MCYIVYGKSTSSFSDVKCYDKYPKKIQNNFLRTLMTTL